MARISKPIKDTLFEHVRTVNKVLSANVRWDFNVYEAQFTEDKDVMRLNKIYSKVTDKWIRDCENMAAKITTTEKAVRRAKACVECAPASADAELVATMTKTFLRRAVVLHIGEIAPRDLVLLRIAGAIQ